MSEVGVVVEDDTLLKSCRSVGVNGTRQRDALLLPARQVDAVFANFGLIAGRQHVEVVVEGAHGQCALIRGLVIVAVEEDVFSDGQVLNPCLLRHVSAGATHAASKDLQLA